MNTNIDQQEVDKRLLLYRLLFQSSSARGLYSGLRAGGVPDPDPVLRIILQSWFEDESHQYIEEFKNISMSGQTYNDININTH